MQGTFKNKRLSSKPAEQNSDLELQEEKGGSLNSNHSVNKTI